MNWARISLLACAQLRNWVLLTTTVSPRYLAAREKVLPLLREGELLAEFARPGSKASFANEVKRREDEQSTRREMEQLISQVHAYAEKRQCRSRALRILENLLVIIVLLAYSPLGLARTILSVARYGLRCLCGGAMGGSGAAHNSSEEHIV